MEKLQLLTDVWPIIVSICTFIVFVFTFYRGLRNEVSNIKHDASKNKDNVHNNTDKIKEIEHDFITSGKDFEKRITELETDSKFRKEASLEWKQKEEERLEKLEDKISNIKERFITMQGYVSKDVIKDLEEKFGELEKDLAIIKKEK